MASAPFAQTADVQARYPSEAAVLCADEASRQPDWSRFDAALGDASTEIRAILASRYNAQLIAGVDDDALGFLALCAIDIAMYRVALSYSRSTEQIRERYDAIVRRLEGIAKGVGALNPAAAATLGADDPASSPQFVVMMDAPPNFGRQRLRDL